MESTLRFILAVIMFGPFAVTLWHLWQALGRGSGRERLRWQIPIVAANFAQSVGFAFLILSDDKNWFWGGVTLAFAASLVRGWLDWAENKASHDKEVFTPGALPVSAPKPLSHYFPNVQASLKRGKPPCFGGCFSAF